MKIDEKSMKINENDLKFQKFQKFHWGGSIRIDSYIKLIRGAYDLKFQIPRETLKTLRNIWNFKYYLEKINLSLFESLMHIWNFKYFLDKINIFDYENQ